MVNGGNRTLNLSIDPMVYEAVTALADEAGVSRSDFIETLIRVYGGATLQRLLRAAGKASG